MRIAKLFVLSVLALLVISSVCFGEIRYGAYSDILGANCGLLLRIDKAWDVQISYSSTGAGATTSYGIAGTYYVSSVRTLDLGWFGEYMSDSTGDSTISLGGTVRHQLFPEVGLKADVYLVSIYSGSTTGSDILPGARIGFTLVIW